MRKSFIFLEPFRVQYPGGESRPGDRWGAFLIPFKSLLISSKLRCIVSDGEGAREDLGDEYAWDHVSVSLANRCPRWEEMAKIKELFFEPDETVFQFHPPKSEYVNYHPYCLHLWRPLLVTIPLPPKIMVGPS